MENVLKFIPEYDMFSWVKNLFFNILSIRLITTSLCTPLRAFSEKTRQILEIRIHHANEFFSNFGSCFGITRPDQISNFLLYHLLFSSYGYF